MKFKIICVIQVKFLKKFNFKYPKNKGEKENNILTSSLLYCH